MLSAGYVSPIYKTSCDVLLERGDFVRGTLGNTDFNEEPDVRPGETAD